MAVIDATAWPRWFAPWRMQRLWRRGPADYLRQWPDGLWRVAPPRSWLRAQPQPVAPGVIGPWWFR